MVRLCRVLRKFKISGQCPPPPVNDGLRSRCALTSFVIICIACSSTYYTILYVELVLTAATISLSCRIELCEDGSWRGFENGLDQMNSVHRFAAELFVLGVPLANGVVVGVSGQELLIAAEMVSMVFLTYRSCRVLLCASLHVYLTSQHHDSVWMIVLCCGNGTAIDW